MVHQLCLVALKVKSLGNLLLYLRVALAAHEDSVATLVHKSFLHRWNFLLLLTYYSYYASFAPHDHLGWRFIRFIYFLAFIRITKAIKADPQTDCQFQGARAMPPSHLSPSDPEVRERTLAFLCICANDFSRDDEPDACATVEEKLTINVNSESFSDRPKTLQKGR